MASKKISRKQWQKYFDTFTHRYLKDQQPEYVEIQVMSDSLGVQPETSWMVLRGITYDPRSDNLQIQVDKMEHMISQPEEIYVEEMENGWITAMQVVQKSGEKNIIEIR